MNLTTGVPRLLPKGDKQGQRCRALPNGSGYSSLPAPGISDRNRNKLNIGEFLMGLRRTARRAMHLSLAEALLAVAVLSTAFLAEIFVFVALGLI
jgi:hypothetical protein